MKRTVSPTSAWWLGALGLLLGLVLPPGYAAEEALHPPIPVTFTLKAPGNVTLVIEDAQGRRVRNLVADTRFAAGEQTVWWDGADDHGDMRQDIDGIYRPHGTLVTPGTYRVRGLVHQPVNLRYVMTPNSAGTPPWITADRTGHWTADHTPPCETLFLPGAVPQVLIGSAVAEAGDGLIYVDLNGRKLKGVRRVGGTWTGGTFLARDRGDHPVPDVLAYAGAGWRDDATKTQGEVRLTALTTTGDREILKYPVKTGDLNAKGVVPAARFTGLAVRNGLLVAGLGDTGELLVMQVAEPKKNRKGDLVGNMQTSGVGTLPLPGVRSLAFDTQGRLLVLVEKQVRRYTLSREPLHLSAPEVLVSTGLEDPQRLALDDQDALYISDWGNSHQVKLFSPAGKFLRAIGQPGAPAAGPYNPLHMNRPTGMTVSSDGHLWVTESDFLPKRVSVWTLDGTLVKAFYGPPDYGAGGEMDPQDKTRFYYADWHAGAMEFRLNWEQGTSEVARVYYRPSPDEVQLNPPGEKTGIVSPQTPIYFQGRQYMTNLFNTRPTNMPGVTGIWLLRDGKAQLVAAVGDAYDWRLLQQEAYAARWPAGLELTKATADVRYERDNPVLFAWSDRNNDGQAQPEEVTMRRVTPYVGSVYLSPELVFTTTQSDTLAPQGFTEAGVPLYDVATMTHTVKDPITLPTPGRDLLTGAEGWMVVASGPVRGYQHGELRWTYPNGWPSLHWGHHAPPVQYPGQLIATTKPVSTPLTLPNAGQLWAYNCDAGQLFLMTTDGLYVTMLFGDGKTATDPRWETLPEAKRGMLLNGIAVPGENFWPRVVQTTDGHIYAVTGKNHSSIVEVEGLDSISRFTGRDLTITPDILKQASDYLVQRDAQRQVKTGPQTMRVALRPAAPVVDGKLTEWADADWVPLDDLAQAAVAVSGDRLYAAFRTQDRNLLTNTGEIRTALFKTGGALDLMIGANAQADAKRKQPVAGDLRLLVTRVQGKPMAMLYQPVSNGAKEPVPFSSPWRTVTFDRVDDVSAQVTLASGTRKEQLTARKKTTTVLWEEYELSIPLAALGLQPAAGMTISGDIGILRGNGGQTVQRLYWHNKATGIVNDVPGEAMLSPQLWGRWQFVTP